MDRNSEHAQFPQLNLPLADVRLKKTPTGRRKFTTAVGSGGWLSRPRSG